MSSIAFAARRRSARPEVARLGGRRSATATLMLHVTARRLLARRVVATLVKEGSVEISRYSMPITGDACLTTAS
eukprot:12690755-Alexandrium_andersonii.AAC.1